MFEKLLLQLHTSIDSFGGKPKELKNSFKENISKKKQSVINSWLWDVPGFRRWRVTRMDAGEKLQVLNSVAYPNYDNEQPILGIDLLWFGVKRRLVAVLDFQPLIQDDKYFLKYFQGLRAIKENYPDFQSREDFKIYDSNNYFSPWLLFFNGDVQDLDQPLSKVLEDFLREYWLMTSCSSIKENSLTSLDIKNLHINYDIYNAERDPAHGLFKSYFGREWADQFVKNFLFPHSIISRK